MKKKKKGSKCPGALCAIWTQPSSNLHFYSFQRNFIHLITWTCWKINCHILPPSGFLFFLRKALKLSFSFFFSFFFPFKNAKYEVSINTLYNLNLHYLLCQLYLYGLGNKFQNIELLPFFIRLILFRQEETSKFFISSQNEKIIQYISLVYEVNNKICFRYYV